jgi:hypothetical protein
VFPFHYIPSELIWTPLLLALASQKQEIILRLKTLLLREGHEKWYTKLLLISLPCLQLVEINKFESVQRVWGNALGLKESEDTAEIFSRPCVHYWKSGICREPETLGTYYKTVGRARHRAHGEFFFSHGSLPSTEARDSRHRLCREPIVVCRPKKVAVNGGLS